MRPLLGAGLAALAVAASPDVAGAVFASGLNAGCYIAAPNQCRIHIEPFTVPVAAGKRLVGVKLQLDGQTIYDFSTDLSNPPPSTGDTVTLSPVALDFAALCGHTYRANVLAKDTGDANFLNLGLTASFTCPNKNALKPPKP